MPGWLGVDHGTSRVGVAVGNTEDRIACPLEVFTFGGDQNQIIDRICQLVREYDLAGVVVGWPVNMDDSEGPQAQLVRKFAIELANIGNLDVRLWDERLSSFQADEYISDRMTAGRQRECRDAMAASVILEDFLSNDGPSRAPRP